MKKTVCMLLSVAMIFSVFAVTGIQSFADEYVATDVKDEAYVLSMLEFEEVEGGVEVYEVSQDIEGDIVIPSEVDGKKVVSISSGAFRNCSKLKSVIIPETVKSIGKFRGCYSLEYVKLPSSLESIPGDAFDSTRFDSSDYITYENGGTYLDNILLQFHNSNREEKFVVREGTTLIAESAFNWGGYAEEDLVEVVLPDSLKIINNYAFCECQKLTTITGGNNVEVVGFGAFEYCLSLKEAFMPAGLKSIGDAAFYWCPKLEKAVIPEAITEIPDSFFYNCGALSDIQLHDKVTYIGDRAFTGTAFYENEANWENGALYIGKFLVALKNDVSSLEVKEGTVRISGYLIEDYLFDNPSLYYLEIPDSVVSIGDEAFMNCSSLYRVTIPASVETIGNEAFGYKFSKETQEKMSSFTIYGETGSAAEAYAIENGFTFEQITEEPEDPTEEPEDPTVEPEDPTVEPEDPTVEPEDPTVEPEDPTVEPEDPSVEPEDPSVEPEDPSVEPEDPSVEPEDPSVDPEVPVVDPELDVKDENIVVNEDAMTATIESNQAAEDFVNKIGNANVNIVNKDGEILADTALVGTGAKIQIIDNDGNVVSEYTVIVPTDVDGNGKTTAADARLALRCSATLQNLEGVYSIASDYNGDGKITAADARKILRKSAGLE